MKPLRRFRKIFFSFLIAALLLLLVALLLPAVVDVNNFRPVIEEKMTQQLGRKVEIQGLQLSLWGGIRLVASNLTLAEDPDFGTQPFLRADSIALRLSLLSLLRGQQDPAALDIEGAAIEVRQGGGRWNVESLKAALPAKPSAGSGGGSGSTPSAPAIRLHRSTVRISLHERTQPLVLTDFSLSFGPMLFGSGYSFENSFSLGTGSTSRVRTSGSFQAIPSKPGLPSPMEMRIFLNDISLDSVAGLISTNKPEWLPEGIAGSLNLDGRLVSRQPGESSLSGKLSLDQLRRQTIAADAGPFSIRTSYDVAYRTTPPSLELKGVELGIGETNVAISGKIDEPLGEARGQLRLLTKEASPADLFRLASLARGGALPLKTSGTLTCDLALSGKLSNPQISGSFDSQELEFVYSDLREPVRISRIHVDLQGNQLKTNQFQAGVGRQASVILSAEVGNLGQDPIVNFQARTSQAAPLLELLRIGSSLGLRLPASLTVEAGTAAFDISGENLRPKSKRFSVRGTVELSAARVRLARLQQPISIPSLTLDLAAGRVRSNRFTVEMGSSGALAASFVLLDTAAGPDLQALLKTTRPLAADQWLVAGADFGIHPPAGMRLSGGLLSLEMDVRSKPGAEPRFTGTAEFRDGSITSKLSVEPLLLRSALLDLKPERIALKQMEARFLDGTFSGDGIFWMGENPRLTLALQGDFVDLARLRTALPANEPSPAPAAGAPEVSHTDMLSRLVVSDGRLSIQRVRNDTLELSNFRGAFTYDKKVLQFSTLGFDLYSGTHQGTLRLDLSGQVPRFQYQGQLAGVDVHELLTRNTTVRHILYGKFSSTCALMGHGSDFESITRNIQGNGIYKLTNGQITTFNLGAQISLLSRLAGWELEGKSTELQEADGSFHVDGPRIFLEKSRVRTPEALVVSDGSVGLDKSLDLTGTAELSDQWKISGNVLGQVISGAAATFFKNEAGRIVVPFRLRGTLEQPMFVLDRDMVQSGLARVLKPENIRSGVQAIGEMIRQVSKPTSSTTPTTPPPAPAKPTGPAPTTTQPGSPKDLVEGIGNLVGGILGAVQRSQPAGQPTETTAAIVADPALVPNVTDMVREIRALAALPLVGEADKAARVNLLVRSIFAVPSPQNH